MAIVTVSRFLGSEGDRIAERVAKTLGYDFVDNALIYQVAERAGVSVEHVMNFDEKYKSRTVEWLKNFISPRTGKIITGKEKQLNPKSYIEYAKTVIHGLAEKGRIVIVGRAGQFILKDEEGAFHVRIVADEADRVEVLKIRHNITGSEALSMLRKSDTMRRTYIEKYLKENWGDPQAYHLVVNSSKLGIDESVRIIVDAVNQFSATHEYIPGVRDRRKGKRRTGEDRRQLDRRYGKTLWSPKEVHHAIHQGRVIRTHAEGDRRKGEQRRGDRRKGNS